MASALLCEMGIERWCSGMKETASPLHPSLQCSGGGCLTLYHVIHNFDVLGSCNRWI